MLAEIGIVHYIVHPLAAQCDGRTARGVGLDVNAPAIRWQRLAILRHVQRLRRAVVRAGDEVHRFSLIMEFNRVLGLA